MTENSWDAAAARAFTGAPEDPPTGVVPPPPEREPVFSPRPEPARQSAELVVTDHFDLTMIDLPRVGAMLSIRPLTRSEALALVREHNPPTMCMNERGQTELEKELQLDPSPRPVVSHGHRLLVMARPRWNDVRWFLVAWESDGDGCVP